MKHLLLLRHAKSSLADPAQDDHDRPLNGRGRRASARMGRLLAEEGLAPDLVLCSTAVRARATARRVLDAAGLDLEMRLVRALYLATPSALVDQLSLLEERVGGVLLVGHNPGLEQLVEILAGRREHLPTGALAAFDLPVGAWTDVQALGAAHLVGLWRPRELGEDGA